MKKEIRALLDREKPAPKRGGYHRSVVFEQAKKPAHYLGSMADTQTPEQRKAREVGARLEVFRKYQRIATAAPTSEKCSHRSCVFPAVLDGECRRHALDRIADFSVLQSQLSAVREHADY